MNPQQAAGVSFLIGASFLVWNFYRAKQRYETQRALSAEIDRVREIAERAVQRPRVRFAKSDTVLDFRQRPVSTQKGQQQQFDVKNSSSVPNTTDTTVHSTLTAASSTGDTSVQSTPAASSAGDTTIHSTSTTSSVRETSAVMSDTSESTVESTRRVASVTSPASPSSANASLQVISAHRSTSAPLRRRQLPKSAEEAGREMLDHDPSAIVHPVLDHSKGVDESDETQFFAYTLGQCLFRSGRADPEVDPDLGSVVTRPAAAQGTSRWRPPQPRNKVTIKRQQKFGVDVRPTDTSKSDFSFVLLCTTDSEIPLACTTAVSLRKEGTSASIVCILALKEDLSSERRMLLQLHMDELVMSRQLAEPTALAALLPARPRLALLLLWKLPRWRCVFVSNYCLALRSADALFHTGTELAAVQAAGRPELDVSVFSAKPSSQSFQRLVQLAAADLAADVSQVINTYLSSGTHLTRAVIETDVPERFCRLSVLYNFTQERLSRNRILPSVKLFNFGAELPGWLQSGIPESAPRVVARLFSRWSVLHSIIDPELPSSGCNCATTVCTGSCISGAATAAGGGAHGDVTAPFERAPWRPTPAAVEAVVAFDQRAEKIKLTTETYGHAPSCTYGQRN